MANTVTVAEVESRDAECWYLQLMLQIHRFCSSQLFGLLCWLTKCCIAVATFRCSACGRCPTIVFLDGGSSVV